MADVLIDLDAARRQAESMAAAGAAIIDVGGESTRPGAADVSETEELDRVIPIIEAVRAASALPISIDTNKATVMREAVGAGASMINDINALRGDGALATAAELDVPVCLMHMHGSPSTMQNNPYYDDITAEVTDFLQRRIAACRDAGLAQERIAVDPGFGFGKTHVHNIELLANLRQLKGIGTPVLVGLSRKSTLGDLTGRAVDERLAAGLSAAVIAVMQGAQIVRTHDVEETVDALCVAGAVLEAKL